MAAIVELGVPDGGGRIFRFDDDVLALHDDELIAGGRYGIENKTLMTHASMTLNAEYIVSGETTTLTDIGNAFVAELRGTKCKRRNCSNNLGQAYRGGAGRGFGPTETLGDLFLIRRRVPHIVASMAEFRAERSILDATREDRQRIEASGRKVYIRYAQQVAKYDLDGYCGEKCQRTEEDALKRRGPEIHPKITRVLAKHGFKRNTSFTTNRTTPSWHGGADSNAWATLDGDDLILRGYVVGANDATVESLGRFSLDQLAAFDAAVTNIRRKPEVEKDWTALNAVRETERIGLEELIADAESLIVQQREDLALARALKHVVGVEVSMSVISRMESILGRAKRRLESSGAVPEHGYALSRMTQTPVPHLLTAEQYAMASKDKEFREAVERLGLIEALPAAALQHA